MKVAGLQSLRKSQSSESLDRLLNGLVLLDDRVHGVLFKVHFLGKCQNLSSFSPRDHDTPVPVGGDNVAGLYLHTVADHRNIGTAQTIVANRSGRNDTGRINGKTNFA